jgi:imidazolonepropionase-like amidohydrolase
MSIGESKTWTRRILSLMVVHILSCSAGIAQKAPEEVTAIENVTVISPERQVPLLHATVVIADGRISQVGIRPAIASNIKRIDGRGKFLIPGLIDSHVHVGDIPMLDDGVLAAHPELAQAYRAQMPRSYLAFGFTTLVDLNLLSSNTLLVWLGATTSGTFSLWSGSACRGRIRRFANSPKLS